MLGLPQRVVFLAMVFLTHVPEVRDLGDPAILPILGVVNLTMSSTFPTPRKDAGLVSDL